MLITWAWVGDGRAGQLNRWHELLSSKLRIIIVSKRLVTRELMSLLYRATIIMTPAHLFAFMGGGEG